MTSPIVLIKIFTKKISRDRLRHEPVWIKKISEMDLVLLAMKIKYGKKSIALMWPKNTILDVYVNNFRIPELDPIDLVLPNYRHFVNDEVLCIRNLKARDFVQIVKPAMTTKQAS